MYDFTYMWNLKIQQTSKYKKKRTRLTDIENKLMVTIGEEWDSKGVREWKLQTFRCEIGYKDVIYNMGNIGNILNDCKWIVPLKLC